MNETTAHALAAINRSLYEDRAAEWNAVRERPWRGFARVQQHLAALAPGRLRVLDLGCGNGRFARALAEGLPPDGASLEYVGVDASAPLLDLARSRAPRGCRFARADFVAEPPDATLPQGPFDLVALLGVLHAIPSRARRRALLVAASARVGPRGLLALTRWRFAECAARRTRIVPWERYNASARTPIDLRDLEPGDHLLSFGSRGALRYCHAVDSAELDALLSDLPLVREGEWFDDGREGSENHYVVLRRDR
jgi:SAM-dependent methyltransferase